MKNFLLLILIGLLCILLYDHEFLQNKKLPESIESLIPASQNLTVTCHDLIVQGGFEMGLSGWQFLDPTLPREFRPIYVTTPTLSKTPQSIMSMQLGLTTNTNRPIFNGIYQKIILPASAETIKLSFYHMPVHVASSDGDFQFLDIVDASTNQMLRHLRKQLQNQNFWSREEFDISNLKGKYVRIEFGVFNDGKNGTTQLFLDEVSLVACGENLTISDMEDQSSLLLPLPTAYVLQIPTSAIDIKSTATPPIVSLPRVSIAKVVNEQTEYVVLLNVSNELDMHNWTLSNGFDEHFVFVNFLLNEKSVVKVHSGNGIDNQGNLYWNRKNLVWDRRIDNKVILKDSLGSVVDIYDLSISISE